MDDSIESYSPDNKIELECFIQFEYPSAMKILKMLKYSQ